MLIHPLFCFSSAISATGLYTPETQRNMVANHLPRHISICHKPLIPKHIFDLSTFLVTDGREVLQMICNNKSLNNKIISFGCRDCRDLNEY